MMRSNNLSRREFLKGSLAGAAIATLGGMGLCGGVAAAEEGMYTPGTYTASAKGINTVVVTMTFSESAITDVVLNLDGETPEIGQAAGEALRKALLDGQTAEIDAVSGASITSKAVREAAEKCIAQAKGEIPVEVITSEAAEEKAPDWLGTEPEVSEVDETWDTDLLIVGAGNGGMVAGAYAARKGLNFRIIEKGSTTAMVKGWYGVIDSKDALALGIPPVDRTGLRNELVRFSSGKCNLKAWNTWINESADMHEFLKEIYADYFPEAQLMVTQGDDTKWPEAQGFFFTAQEHSWGFAEPDRHAIIEQLMEKEAGVKIDYCTTLVKIEKDGARVTGVIAKNTETGKLIRINAAKGVILATGGYASNPVMMEQLDPLAVAVTTSSDAWPINTGDGIKAGIWAGAAMQAEAAPMLFDRGIVAPGVDAGYITLESGDKVFPQSRQFKPATQPFLKVNRRGERFTNESATYDQMSYSAYNQPGGVYAQIFDANMHEDQIRFNTIGCSAATRKAPDGQMSLYEEQIEKGNAFKADTLDELADKLGFAGKDKETFLATCERYNELFDMQEDPDFGKPAYRLSELRTPPFYGCWVGSCILTTEQGLLINEKAQVLDAATREPIEGLLAVGDVSGGFFANNYPCTLSGIAMGRTMTYAIKAVKTVMGE